MNARSRTITHRYEAPLKGGGGRFTEIELNPVVTVADGDDRAGGDGGSDLELAERLHQTAHQQCFIAASVSVPIRCNPTIRSVAMPE